VDTSATPRPSLAARVNAREPLLERAGTCERIRGQIPNLIAVDFSRLGICSTSSTRSTGTTTRSTG